MTEWGVVQTIVVLVGLFLTIGKPVLSFNKTVVEILGEQKNQQEKIKENTHDIDEHEKQLKDHEIRIHDLEQEE